MLSRGPRRNAARYTLGMALMTHDCSCSSWKTAYLAESTCAARVFKNIIGAVGLG